MHATSTRVACFQRTRRAAPELSTAAGQLSPVPASGLPSARGTLEADAAEPADQDQALKRASCLHALCTAGTWHIGFGTADGPLGAFGVAHVVLGPVQLVGLLCTRCARRARLPPVCAAAAEQHTLAAACAAHSMSCRHAACMMAPCLQTCQGASAACQTPSSLLSLAPSRQ
jgi:hypothetical protein